VADTAVVAAAADDGVDGGRWGGRGREGEGGAMRCGGVFCVLSSFTLRTI
jgi:hypothetical protein